MDRHTHTHQRAVYSHPKYWDSQLYYRDALGKWEESVPKNSSPEAGPQWREWLMSWFLFLGAFLLLLAVVRVCQSTLKPL